MLKINKLSFSFDSNVILKDFSCEFKRGERVCISAPSGKGKTTFLRIIASLQKGYSGDIIFDKSFRISMVFQEDLLLPWYTALENVTAVSDEESAKKWLTRFGLGDALEKYPNELSGGMKRRVALCRAVCYGGDILILDEAFKGLDTELKNNIIEYIKEEYKDRLIIFTSHDKEETENFATRVIEL